MKVTNTRETVYNKDENKTNVSLVGIESEALENRSRFCENLLIVSRPRNIDGFYKPLTL